MSVYKAIASVMQELAQVGIAKDRKNAQQGYSFRGIDDIYNNLAPLLSKHGLVILPRVVSHECVERVSNKGGALFNVVVKVEFDFVSAEDGSSHCVTMIGEAMDSGDKASNKAMSAAYKYCCLQTFCIPVEGEDNDADATTHEVMSTDRIVTMVQATLDAAMDAGGLPAAKIAWDALPAAHRTAFGKDRKAAWVAAAKAATQPQEVPA